MRRRRSYGEQVPPSMGSQAESHQSRECPQGGSGNRDGCYKCGKSGHIVSPSLDSARDVRLTWRSHENVPRGALVGTVEVGEGRASSVGKLVIS